MSEHKHSFSPAMPPVNPPLGPQSGNQFYSERQQILQLPEGAPSLTGRDFTVRTIDGLEIMRTSGESLSHHGKQTFTDMQGNEVFILSNKIKTVSESFHAESPQGYNFEIKGKISLMSDKYNVLFHNASNGQDVKLEVRGDWKGRKAEFVTGDVCVAQTVKTMANTEGTIIGNIQTYFVAVAPNVDLSMIAAVCIALDEKEKSRWPGEALPKVPLKD